MRVFGRRRFQHRHQRAQQQDREHRRQKRLPRALIVDRRPALLGQHDHKHKRHHNRPGVNNHCCRRQKRRLLQQKQSANRQRRQRKPQRRINRVAVRDHQNSRQNRRRRKPAEQSRLDAAPKSRIQVGRPTNPPRPSPTASRRFSATAPCAGINHHTPHAMSASAKIPCQFPVTQFQSCLKMLTHSRPIWHPKAARCERLPRSRTNDQNAMTKSQ